MSSAERPADVRTDRATGQGGGGTTGKATLLAVVAAIGGFLFGFDTAVINGAVTAIQKHFQVGAVATGFAVAAALLGCAIGAWFAGRIADRYGRIRVMVVAAALFVVSSLGAGFSFSIVDLTIWRIIGGLGIGAASVIAPAYIAEIAPAYLRGRLGSLQQLAIVLGIFVALLVDAFLAGAAGSAGNPLWFGVEAWRWMFVTCALPALAYGILALQIPESPRYLMAEGRDDAARHVLRQVMSREFVEQKIQDIRATMRTERRSSLSDLRGSALGLRSIVWVGILLSVFQQFVGINVIFYYSSTLWRQVGFTESDSLTVSVLTSVTNVVVTLVAIALIDKVGRKPLLLVGSAGMTLSLGTMALVFGTAPIVDGEPSLGGLAGKIALIAANAFVVFFGVSWGPVVWVLLGEMFSNRLRATALAVAAAAQWIANFIVTTSFPKLASISLGMTYGIYAIMALISLLFVAKYVRETRGRELEDMTDEAPVDVREGATTAADARTGTTSRARRR